MLTRSQTALFASWFTFGFPAILWLFMNKGRYSSSPTKILLTIANVIIIGIACALVRISTFLVRIQLLTACSAASVSGYPVKPFTTTRAARASPARIMPERLVPNLY